MNVLLDMVGCRLNQAEIEALAAEVRSRGHAIVAQPERADLAVINTCSVTQEAASDSRQKVRQVHAARTEVRIALTGCWATSAPEEAVSLPGVAWLIPNGRKNELLDEIGLTFSPAKENSRGPLPREPLPGPRHRTRACLKVQDGCDSRCTFCLARRVRGSSHSRPVTEIIREAQSAQAAGVQEIVLTGLALASFGLGTHEQGSLRRLLVALLLQTDLPRIRLSSLEPWHVSPDLFDLWENPRLCPHLHLPLQSGCARTLQRMARPTTPFAFEELVTRARRVIPDLGLTSEIIVGFPGETAEEFAMSLDFVDRLGFARLHVFPFSPRPWTRAAHLTGQIAEPEKHDRALQARQVAEESSLEFRSRFVGREMQALWESSPDPVPGGWRWRGLTGNSLRVEAVSQQPLANCITRVRLVSLTRDGLWGEVSA